jgi:hypothetical protein
VQPLRFSMNPRTLLTRHIDSPLTLAEAADRLGRQTQLVPTLGNLFIDLEGRSTLRVGGPDLHGDVILRGCPEEESLLAHFRKGDRPIFNALVGALGEGSQVRRPQPKHTEGLDLLEFLQEGHRISRCKRVVVGDAALEDALGCAFDENELLIGLLIELECNAEAGNGAESPDKPGLESVRRSLTGTDRIVLHEGRRVALRLRQTLEGRRNDLNLTVHYAWLPQAGVFLIGGLSETPAE